MKKLILFSLVAIFVATTSCEKDPIIEATPPNGIWDEQIWIRIQEGDSVYMDTLTWEDMLRAHDAGLVDLNTIKFSVRQIKFIPNDEAGLTVMQITTYYGEADADLPLGCRDTVNFPGLNVRTEYLRIVYTIGPGASKDISKILVRDGSRYTNSDFYSSVPLSNICSSIVLDIDRISFEYSYEDCEPKPIGIECIPTRMRLVQNEGNITRSIHTLVRRQPPLPE
jgi:hypothetical protein